MYAIVRVKKYGRAAVNGISVERNREKDDGRNYARSEIDKTATDNNITLIECKHFNNAISKRLEAAGVKERHDSIVMLGALYTASSDYFTVNDKYVELSPEEQQAVELGTMDDPRPLEQRSKFLYDEKAQQFFDDCLDFHIEVYCQGDKSRVFSAKIDFDETTPHMQVYSVPLLERENKKGEMKMHLCAKEIVGNRTDLRKQQDLFHERIGQPRGFERGEKVDWDKPYEERKKHETTFEHNKAARKALEASQTAQIEKNYDIIKEQEKAAAIQQNEIERGRIQLEQQAKAAEALAKSRIKKNGTLFHKEEGVPFKMDMKDYQNATSQVQALNKLLDSPIYTPAERGEMERETEAARQAKLEYIGKLSEIDKLIEERVQSRLELLNITEARRIEQLENQLSRANRDMNYVIDKIKKCLLDHNISIEDFEHDYNVRISETEEHVRHRSR